MTREELSELDKRIGASVARQEAAIARQEELHLKQDELRTKQDELRTKQDELRVKEDELRIRQEEQRLEQEKMAGKFEAAVNDQREANVRMEGMLVEMQARRRWEEGVVAEIKILNGEIITELREGRDERRALIEAVMRLLDRLPPTAPA